MLEQNPNIRFAVTWLSKKYDLTKMKSFQKLNNVFYYDDEGDIVFAKNGHIGAFYVSFQKVWEFLKKFLNLNDIEIIDVLRIWLEVRQPKWDIVSCDFYDPIVKDFIYEHN